jgi:hypothetical protein
VVADAGESDARNVLKERAMPEMSQVELIVFNLVENAGRIHVDELFKGIRSSYVPFTDTEIVSAMWSLKDRRKIDVTATGELAILPQEKPRPRRHAVAV